MKCRRLVGPFAFYCSVAVAALHASPASAEPDKTDKELRAECVSAFETAQEQLASGDLLAAQSRLSSCIRPECPGSVRTECSKLIEQTERAVPTFIGAAKVDGEDRTDATLELDGKVIQQTLDGKAVPVNPGSHVFRFTLGSFAPIEKRVVISEGEKLRSISVEFSSPKKAEAPPPIVAPPAPKAMHRPVPAAVYVLGGVAVLGGASFTYFGSSGVNKQSDLKSTCAPSCSHDDVQALRQKYLVADVSLGVGIAALVTGAILLVARPEVPLEDAQVSLVPTKNGMNASARFRF